MQKQHNKQRNQQQKELLGQDGSKWRHNYKVDYADLDEEEANMQKWHEKGEWPDLPPSNRMWQCFLGQTDLRRRKMTAEGLIHALQQGQFPGFSWQRRTPTLDWLESEGVTAEERLVDLRRWIVAQLRPVMATSPSPALAPGEGEPAEARGRDVDQDREEEGGDIDDELAVVHNTTTEEHGDDINDDSGTDGRDGGGSGGRKQKGKRKREDLEWQVQVAALRLTSALVVLCTNSYAHLFLDPTRAVRRRQAAVPGMLEVLDRVLACRTLKDSEHAPSHDRHVQRSRLRVEAMQSLAVVSLVLEDQAVALELCAKLAQLYLRDVPAPEDRHWWDGGIGDGDQEESDSESEDDDEEEETSDDDSKSDDSNDDEEVTARRQQHTQQDKDVGHAECAAALSTIAFLLSLTDSDNEVRIFLGRHKETLINLFFAPSTEVADSSRVRMNAAALLGVLYRLSSNQVSEDGEDEDGDDQVQVNADELLQMSCEGKRRFLALCQARARRGAGGQRTRGGLERKWERREAGFFRSLSADLHADDYNRSTHRSANADEKEEALDNERVRRERYMGHLYVELQLAGQIPDTFKVEGWRWDLTFGFLTKYFHQYFLGLFTVRPQFRRATKLFPVSKEVHKHLRCVLFHVQKVNRDTKKGKSTQTKRYRKEVDRNWTTKEYFRGNSYWNGDDKAVQSEQRRARAVERERRLEDRGQW